MSNSGSDGDSVVFLLIAVGLAWFAYEKWWDVEPESNKSEIAVSNLTVTPIRPTGLIPITTLKNQTSWWLEADTVKGSRTERLGWVLHDHKDDKKTPYRTSKELWLVDCEKDAYRILSFVSYRPNGEVGSNFEISAEKAEVSYAVPSSNGASVMRKLCQPSFDQSTQSIPLSSSPMGEDTQP
jgi:hypothetical protein